MGVYRMTIAWAIGEAGWTESIFATSPTLAAAITALRTYRDRRLILLPLQIKLLASYIRDVSKPNVRLSHYENTPADGITGLYLGEPPNFSAHTSPIRVALNIRIVVNDIQRRSFLMGGIPTNQITDDAFTGNGTWATRLQAFASMLTNGDYGLLIRTYNDPVGAPIPTVASITPINPPIDRGANCVPSAAVILPGPSAFVYFPKTHGVIPTMRRPFKLRNIIAAGAVPNPFIIESFVPRPAQTGPIQYRLFSIGVQSITAVNAFELTTRKKGRPLFGLRGRASPAR